MDQWCGGEHFGLVSSVPSTCAVLSVLIVLPSSVMAVICVLQIWHYHRHIIVNSPSQRVLEGWNHSLWFFVVCSAAEIIFSIVFSLDDQKSPALLSGIVLHCIAWLLLAIKAVYSLAATRHRLVIDLPSWGYFVVDFCGIGLLALAEYAEDRTVLNLTAAISNFILGLVVLVFSFYVQFLNTRQSYRSLKSGDSTGCMSSCCDLFIGFFANDRTERYSFESPSEENRRSFWSINSDTKSWWGGSSAEDDKWRSANEPLLIDDSTREGLMSAMDRRNLHSADSVQDSAVLSALERRMAKPPARFENGNTVGYIDGQVAIASGCHGMTDVLQRALDRRKSKEATNNVAKLCSDDFSSAPGAVTNFGGGNMQEFSVIIHRWALLRERGRNCSGDTQGASTPPIFSRTSFSDMDGIGTGIDLESGGSVHESLQRQHQRKKSRGRSSSGSNINPNADGKRCAALSGDTAQVEFEICIRGGPCAEMEWWGRSKGIEPMLNKWTVWRTALQIEDLHRSMLSLYGDLAPRRPRLHTAHAFSLSQLQERAGCTTVPAVRRLSTSPGTPSRKRACSPSTSSNIIGASPDHGMKKSSSYSSLQDDSQVSREEIAADMRSIAGYLRAMLNQPAMHCSALFQFLEVPDHLIGSFRSTKAHRSIDAGSNDNAKGSSVSLAGTDVSAFASAEDAVIQSEATGLDDCDDELNSDPRQQWKNQEEEKWRKLYMNLRKGAKPRELLRRCYVFEGCVSGADIVQWLTTKGSIGSVREAESIGEGLVKVGRLIPVCLGLNSAAEAGRHSRDLLHSSEVLVEETSSHNRNSSGSSWVGVSPVHNGGVDLGGDLASRFCNSKTYIYTYPGPTKPTTQKVKPLFHLFGDVISVSITGMAQRKFGLASESVSHAAPPDDSNLYLELRDGTSISSGCSDSRFSAVKEAIDTAVPIECQNLDNSSGVVQDSFIEYEIKCQNSEEEWTVFRRYKEFVALGRLLNKVGIRPREPLPSQLLGKLTQSNNPKRLEERRAQLQAFLRSAITAVVQAHISVTKASTSKSGESEVPKNAIASMKGNSQSTRDIDSAMASLAKFIDKDYDKLRLVVQSH